MSGGDTRERLACLICARNLGDAAIQSGFLRALAARGYADEFLVWTRPQVAFLFEDVPRCSIIGSQFPVGTSKQFGPAAALQLLRAAATIRGRKPTVTVDLLGDFRERLLARLLGSPRHLHIGWAAGHPFSSIIRNPFGPGRPLVTVPVSHTGVYEAYGLMLDAMAPQKGASPAFPPPPANRAVRHVGLHPFASQKCKLWPANQWRQLVAELLARGLEVSMFGAPAERGAALELLGDLAPRVHLVCESLPNFVRYIAGLDVMIGLDSFSVHVAGRHGIPSVMINAGNHPRLWALPPPAITLASSGGCPHYPCFNVPGCEGTAGEYACVKSITVSQVIQAINPS
jgi:heptosyltransferase-3